MPKTIIGHVKVQNRNANEFVDVDIVKEICGNRVSLLLEKDSKPLIYRSFEDEYFDSKISNKKSGLYLRNISKTNEGRNYKGLAKIMDTLAVKESMDRGYGGKVYLYAVGNANPLHWERGFRNVKFLKKPHSVLMQKINNFLMTKRDTKMQKLFDKFVTALKNGQNPRDAQYNINKYQLSSEKMGLPDEMIQKHIEEAKKLNIFQTNPSAS